MNSIKQKHHRKLSYNWEYACEAILTDNYVSIFNSYDFFIRIKCLNWNQLSQLYFVNK